MQKVVIVANANLKNSKTIGSEVDKSDIVVRMNRFRTGTFVRASIITSSYSNRRDFIIFLKSSAAK